VREDGRLVGREEWQEKAYNRMEEAPDNGKKSTRSAHANGVSE
jgi:hypothetical protein